MNYEKSGGAAKGVKYAVYGLLGKISIVGHGQYGYRDHRYADGAL